MGRGSDEKGWGGLLEDDLPAGESTPGVPARPRTRGPPRSHLEPDAPAGRNGDLESPPSLRGRLRSSPVSEEKHALSLPVPAPDRPGPDRSDAPSPLAETLFEQLGAATTDPTSAPAKLKPSPHARAENPKNGWAEYREVALSIVVGIAGIAAAVLYTGRSASEPESETARIDERPKATAGQPARPLPIRDEPKGAAEPSTPRPKTRTPMLSVLTSPPGALVDIGGVVYGKTPLVMPSPDPESLSITLKLGGFRTWRKIVLPEETGHFSVHVKLSKP